MVVENRREVMRVLLSLQWRFYKLHRKTNFKVPFDVAWLTNMSMCSTPEMKKLTVEEPGTWVVRDETQRCRMVWLYHDGVSTHGIHLTFDERGVKARIIGCVI
jgi:hypothetical protein